jgi:multiple sugar transport system substrate-binding protein
MKSNKFNRRDVLKTGGAAGLGLWAASHGLPVLAQDQPEADLPTGAAGKLTVIHRTEYFEAAQNLFRDAVTKFATANNA